MDNTSTRIASMGAIEHALHRLTEDLLMTTEVPPVKTTGGTQLRTLVGQTGTESIIEILMTDLVATVGHRLKTDLVVTVGHRLMTDLVATVGRRLMTDLVFTVGLYCRLMTDPFVTVGLYCRLRRTAPYFHPVACEAAVQTCIERSTGAATHLI